MPDLNITPDDVQSAMQADPIIGLKLQLTAAMRTIDELRAELSRNGHGGLEAENNESEVTTLTNGLRKHNS